MISLSPIAKKIQKRLFEKSNILSRDASTPNVSADGHLNLHNLSTRAVWCRMTSGLERPVIINGGELFNNTEIAAGYQQLYNVEHRPLPGIKNISVGFRGGLKTLREATINWTCWSFDEVERLTPHFLSVGKTVLLEWGWVYNKKSLSNLPTFIDSKGKIKTSAYTDYKNVIINNNGDFDMIVAIVKNFNFTTREDGGFDCTTTISGMGTNMLKNTEPHKNQLGSTTKLKVSENETEEELKEKLQNTEKNIKSEVPMTIKIMVEQLDLYLATKRFDFNVSSGGARRNAFHPPTVFKKYLDQRTKAVNTAYGDGKKDTYFFYEPNQWIFEYEYYAKNTKGYSKTINSWVRWGWFEDNILSKFTTTVSDSDIDIVHSEFRSVEKFINIDGSESQAYEATRVRNHPRFDTIDINRYIMPGQFTPFKKPKGSDYRITGDTEYLHNLGKIVNENFNNFRPSTTVEDSVSYTIESGDNLNSIAQAFGVTSDEIALNNNITDKNKIRVGQKLNIKSKTKKAGGATGKEDKTTGYFRNLLINTKIIKEAFGVSDNDEFTTEVVDINEAIEQMFVLLNQDIYMWDLKIINDETEQHRAKIVDNSLIVPLPEPKKKISNPFLKSKTSRSTYADGEVKNNGVFYFPAWSHDSIVYSQNITSTIPSALAMSIMYGANGNVLQTGGATPAEAGSEEGVAMGAAGGDPENKDVTLKNINRIIDKEGYEKYGYKEGSKNDNLPINPLTRRVTGGQDNLLDFFNSDVLKDRFQSVKDKRKKVEEEEQAMQDSKETTIDDAVDDSVPPPLPDVLAVSLGGKDAFKKLSLLEGKGGKQHPLAKLYSSKYDDDGRMKSQFIESVSYNMQVSKPTKEVINDTNRPILLPLEMELTIDGIGGIYPGNSYHSTYLPKRYRDEALFQAFDINHSVDSSGWKTTISGKMRSTVERMQKTIIKPGTVDILDIKDQFNKSLEKASEGELKAEVEISTYMGDGVTAAQPIMDY